MYLDKILKILRKKRNNEPDKDIQVGTVYEGFKTIPIQNLERIKNDSEANSKDGSKIWFRHKDNKVLFYE